MCILTNITTLLWDFISDIYVQWQCLSLPSHQSISELCKEILSKRFGEHIGDLVLGINRYYLYVPISDLLLEVIWYTRLICFVQDLIFGTIARASALVLLSKALQYTFGFVHCPPNSLFFSS